MDTDPQAKANPPVVADTDLEMEQLAQTADDDSDSDDMFERDEHADLNS
jgi:hypothetical protein